MFAFVGYQLWGTGIETARAQNALEDDFNELLASTVPPAPRVSTVPATTVRRQRPVDTAPAVTLATPSSDRADHVRRARAARAQNLPAIRGGRRDRPARDPIDRRRRLRGCRCREVRSQEGSRPLPRDPAARPARQRRHRRAPHHVRSTVLRHRPGHARRRDHRHHSGGAVRLHRHGSTDRGPERLPGGRHDRPDGRHADPHVVPPAIHRTGSHRDHERTRSDAVGPGRRERPQLRTSARTGRPRAAPLRLDDPTVSTPVETPAPPPPPPSHDQRRSTEPESTEPATTDPATTGRATTSMRRPHRPP